MDANWLQTIIEAFSVMSPWEAFAAVLGMGYVILAARESQWCWPLAFISTLIYTLLFWEGQLPMQALLNFYYMGMAIYGFMLWRHHQHAEEDLPISNWSLSAHAIFIVSGVVLTLLIASYLQTSQYSQSPYLDAGITVFSVMNTWLMARKVLANWFYWIMIDAASVVLYWHTGYYATVVLFSIYTLLAIGGLLNWLKLYSAQQSTALVSE